MMKHEETKDFVVMEDKKGNMGIHYIISWLNGP